MEFDKCTLQTCADCNCSCCGQNDDLMAERDRYRTALERVAVMSIGAGFDPTTRSGRAINLAIKLATDALNPETEKKA